MYQARPLLLAAIMGSVCQNATAQWELFVPAGARTVDVRSTRGSYGHYEYNRKGQLLFYTECGLHGVTAIGASIYDGSGRERVVYSAHSNVSLSIQTLAYEEGRVFYYSYPDSPKIRNKFQGDKLKEIRTLAQLLNISGFDELRQRKRYLSHIEITDSGRHEKDEIYFNERGDTTLKAHRTLSLSGKQLDFTYFDPVRETWRWKIYSKYDLKENLIASYRIEQGDTTEVYNYRYDNRNNCVYQDESFRGVTKGRTKRMFDRQSRLTKESYWQDDNREPDAVTTFRYSADGNLLRKTVTDFRSGTPNKTEIFSYRYTFW